MELLTFYNPKRRVKLNYNQKTNICGFIKITVLKANFNIIFKIQN